MYGAPILMCYTVWSSYINASHCMELQYVCVSLYEAPILMCHTVCSCYINVSHCMGSYIKVSHFMECVTLYAAPISKCARLYAAPM